MNMMNLPDDTLNYILYYVKSENILEKLLVSKKISNLLEGLHKIDHDQFFQSLNERPGFSRSLREIKASADYKSPRDQIIALFRKQHSFIKHFYEPGKSELFFFQPSGNLKNVLGQYRCNEAELDQPIAKSLNCLLSIVCKDRHIQNNYQKLADSEKREIEESYFEENLEKIKTLKELDCSKLGPKLFSQSCGLPPQLALLTNLEKVKLSSLAVALYPNQLLALKSIRKIDLATTYFDAFPKQLLELKNLETIRISNNYLFEIPSEINQLTKLKKLYLTNTRLSEFPKELFQLSCLDKIFLVDNKVIGNKNAMKQLKEHIWLNRNISIFSTFLGENPTFKVLPKEIVYKILIDKCHVETEGQMAGVREY